MNELESYLIDHPMIETGFIEIVITESGLITFSLSKESINLLKELKENGIYYVDPHVSYCG